MSEQKYIVVNIEEAQANLTLQETQIVDLLIQKINKVRQAIGKQSPDYLVIESNMPEFKPTLKKIQKRIADDESAKKFAEDQQQLPIND